MEKSQFSARGPVHASARQVIVAPTTGEIIDLKYDFRVSTHHLLSHILCALHLKILAPIHLMQLVRIALDGLKPAL